MDRQTWLNQCSLFAIFLLRLKIWSNNPESCQYLDFQQREWIFLFCADTIPLRIQWRHSIPSALITGPDSKPLDPSNAEFKNTWICTSIFAKILRVIVKESQGNINLWICYAVLSSSNPLPLIFSRMTSLCVMAVLIATWMLMMRRANRQPGDVRSKRREELLYFFSSRCQVHTLCERSPAYLRAPQGFCFL